MQIKLNYVPPAQFIQANKFTFPVWVGLRLLHYTLSAPLETQLRTGASWQGSSWPPHRAQMSISINHTPAWMRHKKGPDWPCLIWLNSKPVSVMTTRRFKRKYMVCFSRPGAHSLSPWGHPTAAAKITLEIITKPDWPEGHLETSALTWG